MNDNRNDAIHALIEALVHAKYPDMHASAVKELLDKAWDGLAFLVREKETL